MGEDVRVYGRACHILRAGSSRAECWRREPCQRAAVAVAPGHRAAGAGPPRPRSGGGHRAFSSTTTRTPRTARGRLGLLGQAAAGRAGIDAAVVGMRCLPATPSAFTIDTVRPGSPSWATRGPGWTPPSAPLGALVEQAARDEAAGLPDAPWPPHYEKQGGEAPPGAALQAPGAQPDRAAPAHEAADRGRPRGDQGRGGPGERWKARHAGVWPHLHPADVCIDAMRGRSSAWYGSG